MRRSFFAASAGALAGFVLFIGTSCFNVSSFCQVRQISSDPPNEQAAVRLNQLRSEAQWLQFAGSFLQDGVDQIVGGAGAAVYLLLCAQAASELWRARRRGLTGPHQRHYNETVAIKVALALEPLDCTAVTAVQSPTPNPAVPQKRRHYAGEESSTWCDFEINQVLVLARHHIRCGNFARAEFIYRRVLDARVAFLGPEHPAVTDILLRIAALHSQISAQQHFAA